MNIEGRAELLFGISLDTIHVEESQLSLPSFELLRKLRDSELKLSLRNNYTLKYTKASGQRY